MKHIHVTCIIFDETESANSIPALVYVQDFSTNGTYLTRVNAGAACSVEERLSRRDGKILLAPGDRIRISPKIALEFRYAGNVDPNAARLPAAQRREAEVFLCGFSYLRNRLIQNSCSRIDTPSPIKFLAPVARAMFLLPSTRNLIVSLRVKLWTWRDTERGSQRDHRLTILKTTATATGAQSIGRTNCD